MMRFFKEVTIGNKTYYDVETFGIGYICNEEENILMTKDRLPIFCEIIDRFEFKLKKENKILLQTTYIFDDENNRWVFAFECFENTGIF